MILYILRQWGKFFFQKVVNRDYLDLFDPHLINPPMRSELKQPRKSRCGGSNQVQLALAAKAEQQQLLRKWRQAQPRLADCKLVCKVTRRSVEL